MSEVTVFIRQDPNRASKKGQKRPLSIITENDSDDPEAINYTKHQDGSHCHDKENTSCCQNIPDPNKTCQDGEIICKVTEIARNARNSTSTSEYKTILGSKYQVASFPITKLIKFPSIKLHPETRACALENLSGHATLDSDDSKCPDEIFWKQQAANLKSFSSVADDTKITELLQCNQTSATDDNDASVSSDGTQINSIVLTIPADVNGLAKIREKSDRLHITLPLSTSPSTPSPTRNSTFCYRKWQQSSAPKTFQEVKSPVSSHPQQLVLNTNGGPPVSTSLTISSSPESEDVSDKSSSENISPSNSNLGSMFSKFTSSKLSGYFSRRMSNESTGSLSESDLSDGDIGTDDSPSAYLSYFRRLKETTDKLRLSTRRPSIMLWRQQYLESQTFPRAKSTLNSDISDDSLTFDRKHRIDKALEWLRNQLVGDV